MPCKLYVTTETIVTDNNAAEGLFHEKSVINNPNASFPPRVFLLRHKVLLYR